MQKLSSGWDFPGARRRGQQRADARLYIYVFRTALQTTFEKGGWLDKFLSPLASL